ncbi:Mitochondrial GTPase 1 [Entomophthora muscae]|nr:Mitochondrial GTPase 1 [Entomophthora muscae]
MLSKGGVPDFPAAAQHFLKMFRLGKLGNFVFDDISREGFKSFFEYLDLSHKLSPSKLKLGETPTASSVGNYQILPSKQMALRAKRQARLEKIRLKRLSMPAPKF